MDLMAFVPNYFGEPADFELHQRTPHIVHNCEVAREEKDPVGSLIKGKSLISKLRRWFLRQRLLSRKHPLTRWCLKSRAAINYEMNRHLRSYPYMIHPFSPFRVFWESMMTVFAFLALLVTPVLLTFYLDQHRDWHVLANAIDAVFISDIIVWFFTGYYDYRTKSIVLDPVIVARKYLKRFFFVDLLSVLPLEFLENMLSQPIWLCSLLNMLKILRIKTIVVYGRRLRYVYRVNFQLHKIIEISVIVIMCIHWSACCEYYVPTIIGKLFGVNEEATTALVCSAHYLEMRASEDIILNLILTVIGLLGFVYLLGECSQLMTTFHSTKKRHMKLIQQLREYMKHKELPQSLQRRLLTFYNYRNKKGSERDKQIIEEVSPYLREELILHSYMKFVSSVELFKHLPGTIARHIATHLKSEILMPGDVIVKAGTPGDAMYFVSSGSVAVCLATGKEICQLENGAYFGEIALVMETEHRIATVVALETTEIHVLCRADFQRVMAPYPDLLSRLQGAALDNLERPFHISTEGNNSEGSGFPRNINISSIKGTRRK